MTPMAPKLTMVKDPTSSDLTPQIQLMKYRGMAGDGGFLNFDCNLGLERRDQGACARLKRAMLPGDQGSRRSRHRPGTVR
jgi:hypothetical protein